MENYRNDKAKERDNRLLGTRAFKLPDESEKEKGKERKELKK